ncbi:hypothetical protein RND81_10G081200 [Saponaria officinalis]|uniref:Uncharacterized protein n=1 Tax=Saponaria officinalis TaxID=3572 RepID=A0AAW1I1R1_SAPOF
MGIKDWNTQKSQSFTFGRSNSSSKQQCIKLGKTSCHRGHEYRKIERSRWKMLWMKIKKEKQRFLSSNNNIINYNSNNNQSSIVVAYDAEAYARNFDEGFECKEPEYLTRSFSARFADPSRIVCKKRFLT